MPKQRSRSSFFSDEDDDDRGPAYNLTLLFIFFLRQLVSLHGLTVINIGYLLFGTFAFYSIEAAQENAKSVSLREQRSDLVDKLRKLGVTAADKNFTVEASKLLATYEASLVTFYRKRVAGISAFSKDENKTDDEDARMWTTRGSAIFCFSVVTSIGWGNITPGTTLGKMGTIIYGLFGMPLLFTLSNEFGVTIAKVVLFFWKFMPGSRDASSNNPKNQKTKGDKNVNSSPWEAQMPFLWVVSPTGETEVSHQQFGNDIDVKTYRSWASIASQNPAENNISMSNFCTSYYSSVRSTLDFLLHASTIASKPDSPPGVSTQSPTRDAGKAEPLFLPHYRLSSESDSLELAKALFENLTPQQVWEASLPFFEVPVCVDCGCVAKPGYGDLSVYSHEKPPVQSNILPSISLASNETDEVIRCENAYHSERVNCVTCEKKTEIVSFHNENQVNAQRNGQPQECLEQNVGHKTASSLQENILENSKLVKEVTSKTKAIKPLNETELTRPQCFNKVPGNVLEYNAICASPPLASKKKNDETISSTVELLDNKYLGGKVGLEKRDKEEKERLQQEVRYESALTPKETIINNSVEESTTITKPMKSLRETDLTETRSLNKIPVNAVECNVQCTSPPFATIRKNEKESSRVEPDEHVSQKAVYDFQGPKTDVHAVNKSDREINFSANTKRRDGGYVKKSDKQVGKSTENDGPHFRKVRQRKSKSDLAAVLLKSPHREEDRVVLCPSVVQSKDMKTRSVTHVEMKHTQKVTGPNCKANKRMIENGNTDKEDVKWNATYQVRKLERQKEEQKKALDLDAKAQAQLLEFMKETNVLGKNSVDEGCLKLSSQGEKEYFDLRNGDLVRLDHCVKDATASQNIFRHEKRHSCDVEKNEVNVTMSPNKTKNNFSNLKENVCGELSTRKSKEKVSFPKKKYYSEDIPNPYDRTSCELGDDVKKPRVSNEPTDLMSFSSPEGLKKSSLIQNKTHCAGVKPKTCNDISTMDGNSSCSTGKDDAPSDIIASKYECGNTFSSFPHASHREQREWKNALCRSWVRSQIFEEAVADPEADGFPSTSSMGNIKNGPQEDLALAVPGQETPCRDVGGLMDTTGQGKLFTDKNANALQRTESEDFGSVIMEEDDMEEQRDYDLPVGYLYFILFVYMLGGAFVQFMIYNTDTHSLSYTDCVYFVYVLFSTTGFGDILLQQNSYIFFVLYGFLGMAIFNIMVNQALSRLLNAIDFIMAFSID